MNLTKDQLREWVAALRSGDYKQGHGTLCRDVPTSIEDRRSEEQTFCCMGVACDLFLDADWVEINPGLWGFMTNGTKINGRGPHHENAMPPWELRGAINQALPSLSGPDDDSCQALVVWNDEKGHSFKTIAYYIERAAGLV